MEKENYSKIVTENHIQDEDYKFWLQTLLNDALFSVIALKAKRDVYGKIIDFSFLFLNNKAEESMKKKNLTGNYFLKEFPSAVKTGLFQRYSEVTEKGIPWEDEIHYNYDGYDFWFSIKATKLNDGCLVISSDITENKRVEEELKEKQKYIEHVTTAIPGIIYVNDVTTNETLYSNLQIGEILGYSEEEIERMGKKLFKMLVHPDDFPKIIERNKKLDRSKDGKIEAMLYRVKDKNDNWRWLHTRATVFNRDDDGKLSQILGIATDVTEQRESRRALVQEKSKNIELKRINELMDTFVYAAAHDLKSPLSNLKLLTNFINETDDKDTKLKLLEKYPTLIETLEKTINGLVRMLEVHNDSETQIKNLHFNDIFGIVIKELHESTLAEAEIFTDFSKYPSINYVESYLISILRNILVNAVKYRCPSRKLSVNISTLHEGKYVLLTITDNGIGINLEKFGQDLFKPFKRFTRQSEGSGIGLYLIKSIVSKNGGYIKIDSKIGEGTTFKIYLVQYTNLEY